MDLNNYKVEWSEPSYGCCFMYKTDAEDFKNAIGAQEEIYTKRHDILQSYATQKPFNGDGKLYFYTWEQYKNTLPHVDTINKAMKAEKIARYNIIFNVSQNLQYKTSILKKFSTLSPLYSTNPLCVFENKSSFFRRQEEGLKQDCGNIIKATNMLVNPAITDLSTTLSGEVVSAKLQTKDIVNEKIEKATESATKDITESFTALATSIKSLKKVATEWKAKIVSIKAQLIAQFQSAVALGKQMAMDAYNKIEELKTQMEEAAKEALESALTAIATAFSGIATMVFTALPFTNFILNAIDMNTNEHTDMVMSGKCDKLDQSRDEEGNPISASLLAMDSRCYETDDDGNEEQKQKAYEKAYAFANLNSGTIFWDKAFYRYIVFYTLNNHTNPSDQSTQV